MINRNNIQNWTPSKSHNPIMNISPMALIVFDSGKPFRIIEYVFNNIVDTYCKGLGSIADIMITKGYNLVCHEKEMMIEINPFIEWIMSFNNNLSSYASSIFDGELNCDYLMPFFDISFKFYVKHSETDKVLEEIILKDGEFIYRDEFEEVLNEQYLSVFLKKLSEIHPGIEIPEINWNYTVSYEKHH